VLFASMPNLAKRQNIAVFVTPKYLFPEDKKILSLITNSPNALKATNETNYLYL
jgi:P pilus assembly chaperone PapD